MTAEVRTDLERTFGPLHDVRKVGGGCISPAHRVVLGDGRTLFVKTAATGAWHADAFAQEALSLERLRATSALVIPHVHGYAASWLALDWLEPVPASERAWTELGSGLARVHHEQATAYGWESRNYIGPLPQSNAWARSWPAFWREQRLGPQLEQAAPLLDASTMRAFDRLLDELGDRLAGVESDGASLLHGDLWNGNVHVSVAGAGVIDPASYYGHREVDLAMAALFGGFPPGFYDAYAAEWPPLAGAAERRPIYQLYYLLVHVVLFGVSYVPSVTSTLRSALR